MAEAATEQQPTAKSPAPAAVGTTKPAKLSAAEDARIQVEQGIVERVAIGLKKNFEDIHGIAQEISGQQLTAPVDDDSYRTLAKEAIEKRQFTLKNLNGESVIIPLDKIGFSGLIPTTAQVGATSKAVADGIEENTGGLFGLFDSSLGNIFSGLIEWISNGFKGGVSGLFETIGKLTTNNIAESVKNNLTAADTGLDKDQRAEIVEIVRTKANERAGIIVGNSHAKPEEKLSDIKAPNIVSRSPSAEVSLSESDSPGIDTTSPKSNNKGQEPIVGSGVDTTTTTPKSNNQTNEHVAKNKLEKDGKVKKQPDKSDEHKAVGNETNASKRPEPPIEQKALGRQKLLETVTAVTAKTMRGLDKGKEPDNVMLTKFSNVVANVLEDNPELLKNGKYDELADKAVDSLLRNKDTSAGIRSMAIEQKRKEINAMSGWDPEKLLEKAKLEVLEKGGGTVQIKEKMKKAMVTVLEGSDGKVLAEAMEQRTATAKPVSMSGLVPVDHSIKLSYADVPGGNSRAFVPQGTGVVSNQNSLF